MKIDEIINQELIDLDITAGSKIEALNSLVELLYKANRVSNKKLFLEEILVREKIETTDLGIGIAIPHGRCLAVVKPSVAIGKLITPIKWNESNEAEEELVYAVFLMASSPDSEEVSHMDIISRIATLLIDDDFVAFLKYTDSADQLLKRIKQQLGET